MALTSRRESILNFIKTTSLVKINGTGNYNFNAKLITRKFYTPDDLDISQKPTLMIIDDSETQYKKMTSMGEYVAGDEMLNLNQGLVVGIMGYVQVGDGEEPSTQMNKLYSDIILAMMDTRAELIKGGFAESTRLISSQNSLHWINNNQGTGAVLVIFSIKYRFNPLASSPVT